MAKEMRKFNVKLAYDEKGDWISWDGDSKPIWRKNILINTYNDHRMAMGLAPLSLRTDGLIIDDPMVVSKSYPGFWKDMEKAGFKITTANEDVKSKP